jgi:hypothetical protein
MNDQEKIKELEYLNNEHRGVIGILMDEREVLRGKVAELEKALQDGIKTFGELQFQLAKDKFEKQSEPVAWMSESDICYSNSDIKEMDKAIAKYFTIPLYITPQTKPLSIDEAVNIFESVACKEDYKMKDGIQAVLDAIEAKVRGEK